MTCFFVSPPGMVGHHTLNDAYARAGFVLYPTAFPGRWNSNKKAVWSSHSTYAVNNRGEIPWVAEIPKGVKGVLY